LDDKRLEAEFIEKGKLSVKSRFWEVVHDPERGGCITSIRFFNGSNENILLSPISSYLGSFMDTLEDSATLSLTEENGRIRVRVNGELKDSNKAGTGVKYDYTYEYREGHVKITRRYSFEKGVAGVWKVGIGCMDIVPELNDFAARPSHVGADKRHATCAAKWGKIDFDNKVAFEEKSVPLYMAVFRRGVEGIEYIPSPELSEWTRQLIGETDQGCFQIRGESGPKQVRMIVEPLSSKGGGYLTSWHPNGIQLSGEYTFSSYIGLPKIPDKVPRKHMHMAFDNHPWPSDEGLRRWAYSGVTIVRLHNDFHPSGDFWHDGSWPPYDERGMSELRRVIATCHKYGIKIVPYFSLYEINPKSDAFADGYIVWRRTVDEGGSLIETYPPNHYYGFGMCLKSGWKDFLKEYVKKVIKTLGFDGIYYDYSHYWFCSNRLHSKGDHTAIDDLIDFMDYTKDLVGKDGVMLLHQSGWFPFVLIENYADGHIMFEDNVHWKEIPPLEEFPPNTSHLTFMNVAPKIPCPIVGVPDRVRGSWNLCAKCSVLGAFPHWGLGPEGDPILALFEVFRAFDLSKFRFKDYTTGYIVTSDNMIKGAIYFNEKRALVVLANVGEKPIERLKWTIDLQRIGWDPTQKYFVAGTLGETFQVLEGRDLLSKGIEDSLEGFRFKAYSIGKYRDDEKYVLYNTRAWTESYTRGKLVVETKGPTGQEASLKFHSPEKPKEISLDSKALEETKDWSWEEATKIGAVKYRYTKTGVTVKIEIQ